MTTLSQSAGGPSAVKLSELRNEVADWLARAELLLSRSDRVLGREEHYSRLAAAISNERNKVLDLELRMAITAPMKAGKSTIINSILGRGILPTRNSAMTTIPSEIVRDQALSDPVLQLHEDTIARFVMIWDKIHKEIQRSGLDVVIRKASDYPELQCMLQQIADRPTLTLETNVAGFDAVQETMVLLNDLCRLARPIIPDFSIFSAGKRFIVPRLVAPFTATQSADISAGALVIVDTPGPNEASNHSLLEKIVVEQLDNTSLVLLVLDYTQLNTQAAESVSRHVQRIVDVVDEENLFVLVNKIDERNTKGMNTDEVQRFVTGHLRLKSAATKERIFEISAKQAFCATDFLSDLNMLGIDRGNETKVRELASARELARLVFGATSWTEELSEATVSKLEKRAGRLWELSGFAQFLSNAIEVLMRDVAPLCISNALNVTRKHLVTLRNDATLRKKAINKDAAVLKSEVAQLGKEMAEIELCRRNLDVRMHATQTELKAEFDKVRRRLQQFSEIDIREFFKKSEYDELTFFGRLRNWSLAWFGPSAWDIAEKPEEFEFESRERANDVVNLAVEHAIDRARPNVERALRHAGHRVEVVKRELEGAILAEIKPILDQAKERLQRTFDVQLEIPQPDLGNPLAEVTAPERISKHLPGGYETQIRYERRWYTLWLWNHEVYHFVKKADKYKVCLSDVVVEVNESIRRNLDNTSKRFNDFLEMDFKEKVDNYFKELRAYMGFYSESLLKAQEAQELSVRDRQDTEDQLTKIIDDSAGLVKSAETMQQSLGRSWEATSRVSYLNVFVMHANEDSELWERLRGHLLPMERDGLIRIKSFFDVSPGQDIRHEISLCFMQADIVTLLVSADFFKSYKVYDDEMREVSVRQSHSGTRVVPIILRDCDWQQLPFGGLSPLPSGGKAIASFSNQDEVMAQVARELRNLISRMQT